MRGADEIPVLRRQQRTLTVRGRSPRVQSAVMMNKGMARVGWVL